MSARASRSTKSCLCSRAATCIVMYISSCLRLSFFRRTTLLAFSSAYSPRGDEGTLPDDLAALRTADSRWYFFGSRFSLAIVPDVLARSAVVLPRALKFKEEPLRRWTGGVTAPEVVKVGVVVPLPGVPGRLSDFLVGTSGLECRLPAYVSWLPSIGFRQTYSTLKPGLCGAGATVEPAGLATPARLRVDACRAPKTPPCERAAEGRSSLKSCHLLAASLKRPLSWG